MGINRHNKPAALRTRETRGAKIANPLEVIEYTGNISTDAMTEMERIRAVFLECDSGQYRGPFAINSPHFFTIAFEAFKQREAFRRAMQLDAHGEQYWSGEAFLGSLEHVRTNGVRSFQTRKNPFADRANPFERKGVAELKKAENATKYSNLRAEVKKTQEKMARLTEDRTWISVCFPDAVTMDAARKELSLPAGKFVHIDDILASLEKIGVTLDVPRVEFALRALTKPDKALNALVS